MGLSESTSNCKFLEDLWKASSKEESMTEKPGTLYLEKVSHVDLRVSKWC